MITIGQLARYVGVSAKTVRVYHDKGLFPEPDRDASGYRRYGAADAVALIRIRALTEAGVPLARVRELRAASGEEFGRALREIDDDLTARIDALRATRARLRGLAEGRTGPLPDEVVAYLDELPGRGFTARWVELQRDLWTLVFVTDPDQAVVPFRDQRDSVSDPALIPLFLAYDRAYALDPGDPRIDRLAHRIAEATRRRYGPGEPPGPGAAPAIPALVQRAVNDASPAWRRLDALVRARIAG
ncbi:MerR family transcriptional regulator [Streptomyces avicenniae]|uniref:MerR family transcriptional regulator n=1 Tax=Streptomyces avicenniae TaxID=500153 RepID=UPI00069B7E52|nr:MerR family transcriptional regulator [Streptomyces avicenniae]